MKQRLFIFAMFACGVFAPVRLEAQNTPNIGLTLPVAGQLNWSVPLNQDLSLLDLYLSGNAGIPGIRFSTTGTQPTCNSNFRGNLFIVQGNGTTTTDSVQVCTLQSSGSYVWTSLGGSAPAVTFSSLLSGTNTVAAMLVGTGASLAATGSGSITATTMAAAGLTGQVAISAGGTGTSSPHGDRPNPAPDLVHRRLPRPQNDLRVAGQVSRVQQSCGDSRRNGRTATQ